MKRLGEARRSRVAQVERYRLGHSSEMMAIALLIAKGYLILERRYRSPVGEVDIIARRGRRLAFIEVKHRPTLEESAESITPRQQERVMRAAEWWLKGHARVAALTEGPSFDVVLLAPGKLPRHMRDAFEHVTGRRRSRSTLP
jgi:putative endonuclease